LRRTFSHPGAILQFIKNLIRDSRHHARKSKFGHCAHKEIKKTEQNCLQPRGISPNTFIFADSERLSAIPLSSRRHRSSRYHALSSIAKLLTIPPTAQRSCQEVSSPKDRKLLFQFLVAFGSCQWQLGHLTEPFGSLQTTQD
jgi:hypothetical protein